ATLGIPYGGEAVEVAGPGCPHAGPGGRGRRQSAAQRGASGGWVAPTAVCGVAARGWAVDEQKWALDLCVVARCLREHLNRPPDSGRLDRLSACALLARPDSTSGGFAKPCAQGLLSG